MNVGIFVQSPISLCVQFTKWSKKLLESKVISDPDDVTIELKSIVERAKKFDKAAQDYQENTHR